MEQKTTILLTLLFSFASLLTLPIPTTASPPISAVFAFGDLTMDSGNNNHLTFTLFKSDHKPYGKDLPNHVPSGRFSNGKLATYFMVSKLGLKDLLPAYHDPKVTDRDLPTGVSFASGGGRLDDLTLAVSKAVSMSRQLEAFDEALGRMRKTVGAHNCSEIVKNAVFVISAGTNDMMFNMSEPALGQGNQGPKLKGAHKKINMLKYMYNKKKLKVLKSSVSSACCAKTTVNIIVFLIMVSKLGIKIV